MFSLQILGSVGPDEENDANDIADVGRSLVGLGYESAGQAAGTGAWNDDFESTVKSFQAGNGLEIDGILHPGGPTEAAINGLIESRRSAASPSDFATEADTPDPPRPVPPFGRGLFRDVEWNAPSDRAPRPVVQDSAFAREHRRDGGWTEGNSDLPPISDRASKAIAAGARLHETQFDNLLKLLGPAPQTPATTATPEASETQGSDDADRVLFARGYRYVPDPMGRIGWGDWVDVDGRRVDPIELSESVQAAAAPPSAAVRLPGQAAKDRGDPSFAHEVLRITNPRISKTPKPIRMR